MKVIETTMQKVEVPLNDGFKEMKTESVGHVKCRVLLGGLLMNKKGVNTPSVILPISPLTPKDRSDLEFILSTNEFDWVALSFVQRPEDIQEIKSIAGNKVKIMAKLEKPSAIEHLNKIVQLSDAIMVARGDLGVEMEPWDVPVLQKRILHTVKQYGRPVVIATQMMESMITLPSPTRAEASDCATAIYDFADAVMLSAESASGKYPVEAVNMQQQIIQKVETEAQFQQSLDKFANGLELLTDRQNATTVAITMAARQVADFSRSKAIVAFTSSGTTALRMAKLRPKVPIIAICEDIKVARQLSLVWGVYPVVMERQQGEEFNLTESINKACKVISKRRFTTAKDDLLTITAGLPWGNPGSTNIIRVTSAAGCDHQVVGSIGA